VLLRVRRVAVVSRCDACQKRLCGLAQPCPTHSDRAGSVSSRCWGNSPATSPWPPLHPVGAGWRNSRRVSGADPPSRLPADLAAAQIHDTRSQVPTRAEAALPLLWWALLRRGPTRSSSCYAVWALPADLAARSRSRRALRLLSRCYGGPCFDETPRAAAAAMRSGRSPPISPREAGPDARWGCSHAVMAGPASARPHAQLLLLQERMGYGVWRSSPTSLPRGSTEQTGLDTIALWSSVMLIISHPQGLYLSSFCLHASPYYASPLRPLFALWQPNYIYCRPHSCVLGFWVHQHLLKGLVFCCRWHAWPRSAEGVHGYRLVLATITLPVHFIQLVRLCFALCIAFVGMLISLYSPNAWCAMLVSFAYC
jgi:hypothetical protein